MFNNLSNEWKTGLQVFFVLVVLGAAIFVLSSMGATQTNTGSHQLAFEVKASGGYAIITLQAGATSIKDPKTVTVPWKRTIAVESGVEVYLTASNPTETGQLSCAITLDGTVWKTEKNNAPKNGVACAGIVP